MCICLFISVHVETSDAGATHPVHDEDLADVEFMLKLFGSDGHRVEETEAPMDVKKERMAATCC